MTSSDISVPVITDDAALQAFCHAVAQDDFIAIDTEFVRRTTYYSVLCLIQIAGSREAAIIDPIAAPEMSLTPLFALMRDPNVVKVFHAARQDIEIFYHLDRCIPSPLFDTQVAAMVCGFDGQVGYEKLVRELTGAQLDKSQRFTDWSHRPLTAKQLDYALGDVTHLRKVYEVLRSRVVKNGREGWIAEETAILTNPDTYDTIDAEAWVRLKPRSRDTRFLTALQAIASWRERTAKLRDRPRRHILKDEVILELAATRPTSREAIGRVLRNKAGLSVADQDALITLIADAEAHPDSRMAQPLSTKPKPLSEAQEALYDMLRMLLKHCCREASLATRLVADGEALKALVRQAGKGRLDPREHPSMHGWRYEVFGKAAEALLEGRLVLRVENGSPSFVED